MFRRRREQYQSVAVGLLPGKEGRPRRVPHDRYGIEVIHSGAAERAVRQGKSGRRDQVRLDAEAGTQAQDGSGVLRYVRLIEGDAHRVWAIWTRHLHSTDKDANRQPPDSIAADLPQAGAVETSAAPPYLRSGGRTVWRGGLPARMG